MEPLVWLAAVVVLIVAALIARPVLRGVRRRRLRAAPFPPEWQDILQRHVSLYRHLPEEWKAQLHGDVNVFLDEKRFEGCGGLEISDEMRVTNPAEFFAVATETFFEKPRQLHRHEPDLYAVLKDYYHLDPVTWTPQP